MRMMVVEDERIIREGLVQMIGELEDIEVVAACENAAEGFDMIASLRPDAVISDIVLGDETGIDMISRCRSAQLDCEFVLLSGYSEFEYAQQALRLGVFDYLNKPLDAEKLRSVIERLRSRVALRRQSEDHALEYFARNRGTAAIPLPSSLLHSCFYLVCINIFTRADGAPAEAMSTLVERACHVAVRDYRRLLEQDGMCYLLLTDAQDRDSFAHELVTQVMCSAGITGLGLHLGMSACFEDVHLLGRAMREATAAQQHAAFVGKLVQSVEELDYEIMENIESLVLRNFSELRPRLQGTDAQAICQAVFAQADGMRRLTPPYAIIGFFRLCGREALFAINGSGEVAAGEDVFAPLQQAVGYELLRSRFESILNQHIHLLSQSGLQDQPDALSQARQYINLHYTENLSGEMVARMFFMDPAYFSKRFKKVYGVNYNDYIFTLRMEKAKQLLMLNSYTVAEVAEHVGYQSAKYFSKMFRRHTGLLPSEFYDKKVHQKDKTT